MWGQVRITEFMASNTSTLVDEDGSYSDWIEIQNTSSNSVNLLNWSLTDSSGNPGKWRFPATNIAAKAFIIVFADGKDRATNGAPLHTNFKLGAEGEYLALFQPDGSVATEIAPQYPQQFPDISYGIGMQLISTTLVATNAKVQYLVPRDAAAGSSWTQNTFDDSAWSAGTNGTGYETGIEDALEESFAAKVLATQPQAYWRLNETTGIAAVNSGSEGVQAEGGYLGAVSFGQPGPRPPTFNTFETNNYAPLFNGIDAYVNGPYQYLNALPAFTLGGWIYPTAAQNDRTGLFGQNDTVEFGFISGSTIQAWTPVGSLNATYPFPNNQWHYVNVVGGNGQLSLYFDGNPAGSTSINSPNFGESDFDFNIGGGGIFDGSGNYFKGAIDEVAVWYRALSNNEIKSLLATNAGQVNYTNFINTDIQQEMYGSNGTAYVRIPFVVNETNAVDSLQLLMRFDDGFAAYLNGHLIANSNAPANPNWNSTATQRQPDLAAVQWTAIDVTGARGWLLTGTNILAIQGLNISPTNTDFLLQAQLLAQSVPEGGTEWRYFTGPTPRAPNGTSPNDFGPIMSGAAHTPPVPAPGNVLTVSAQVAPGFNPIGNVTLHYRIMFNAEVSVAMNDAGTNGDATGGDGIWTGIVPGGAAAGQLIRYYVTAADVAGNSSRWPLFPNPTDSEEYYGTVVQNSSIHSQLPVVHLFMQNPGASDNRTGTRGSIFYGNELYDNVLIYVHGQSSTGWPKKSHNIDFPKDHSFLYQAGGAREKKVIFLSNYGDKARMHTSLTYATTALSGGGGLFSFPIRIQLNGAFWGIEDMVEHGDELWLERIGRGPDGALYKMYNNLSSASGNEKKTREWEGTADLSTFIANLDESLPLATRVTYGYDNFDLAQMASYFADMAIASSQDLGHKNYYVYRDSDGTGEWSIFPWDVDLTWGRNWLDSAGYFTDTLYLDNVLNFYNSAQQGKPANRLFDLMFAAPDFRQMYLRRLRTLMDTILMPNGTPTNQLVVEPLVRQYEAAMNPPNVSPSDSALDYAAWGPSWGNTTLSQFPNDAERIISVYLPGRRNFLYGSGATLNGELVPAGQPTNAAVAIGAWDYNPISGNFAEQYVQLQNTNNFAIDISRWRLTGSIDYTLRPGTVIPAGKSLYVAANVNAFRRRAASPHAGQNIFVQGPFGGFLSSQGNSALILYNDRGMVVSQNSFAGNLLPTPFVAGNLVVLRVGNGAELLSNQGNSIYIDQFNTNGVIVGSLALPNYGSNALVISGSSTSEGALSRSADGRLLMLAGYNIPLTNTAALTTSLANASATEVPRALAAIDLAGGFVLTGVTTNQFGGNNMRSGTSDGFGNYWGVGANSGTYYFGDGPAATVQNVVSNSAVIEDLGGDLYFSTSKTIPGIWKIPGSPFGPATPGVFLSAGAKASPFAFAFSPDMKIAYLADDTLKGTGGVQRWDLNGSVWLMSYAFSGLTNIGARGVAVDFNGASPVIYATTAESTGNRLVSITDTGMVSATTALATAGINQIFRGVAFAPTGAPAPRLFQPKENTNGFSLNWTAVSHRNYTVEYSDTVSGGTWRTLTNMTASSPVLRITDISAPATTNRFYRVLLNP